MALNDGAARPGPRGEDDDTFPQFPRTTSGPPSIISSRMTDVGSDDGRDGNAQNNSTTSARRSALPSETVSRPGSARTGISSSRGPGGVLSHIQPLKRGLSASKRGTGVASSGDTVSGRPASPTTSRSHVPSLTSHAFFHPMSSQKLQAQRGGVRPPTIIGRKKGATEDSGVEASGGATRQSVISIQGLARQLDDVEDLRPPSHGTEVTEQNTLDRIAKTNPTRSHYPTASLSESVRPLQKKTVESRGLSLNIDKSYKNSGRLPSPIKSPRSFRSSFLPSKSNRGSKPGREKLESAASSPRLTPTNSAAPQTETKTKLTKPDRHSLGNNFEYFEGNTAFCLGGRLQNARHRPVNIATGFVVVLPAVLFFVFVAPWLWHNISPAIPVIFAYLFYICLSSFLHASGSDPGILPRSLHKNPQPDENEDPLRLAPPNTEWTLVKSAGSSAAAMEVPTKYCRTCHIWRPPRAHHCRLCDNCIETADHHCVWINNCVGRRNYRYFFTFLVSAALGSAYLLGASLAQILVSMDREGVSFGRAINDFPIAFAMVIYGFLGFLYPAALTGYHVFLMSRGETTREYLASRKFSKKDRYRAFTQGNWVSNWIAVLCRPRPPTYYHFKKKYVHGDQRLGIGRGRLGADSNDDQQGMEMQHVTPAQ